MARNIRKIEALPAQAPKPTRVAAYARFSSGKDAMLESLSAQGSYYNGLIQKRRDWEFAGVFADEAIKGTKDSRTAFQELLTDCRAGKIDMVITKLISRLARNTVTLLETVRELKALGIDVYFEKENIHSCSGDGELLLTILASYALEESRSASENCKWRVRQMFEQGQTNNGVIIGYRLIDGQFMIMPEEATIVRQIYADYLSGMGFMAIAMKLNQEAAKTRRVFEWGPNSVHIVLQNEKYTGDMLLDIAAQALRLESFDETTFDKQIKEIIVPAAHRLVFVYHDGHETELSWENRSRRESWSDDMREAARQKEMERRCHE